MFSPAPPSRLRLFFLAFGALLLGIASPSPAQIATLVEDLLLDLEEGTFDTGSRPRNFQQIGDRAVFFAQTEATGQEMWSTDGTSAGTQLLVDSCPGNCSSGPFLGRIGGLVFWAGVDPHLAISDSVIWRTDGTRSGTVQIFQGGELPFREDFEPAVVNGALVFKIIDSDSSRNGLWRTDGSPEGTFKLGPFTPHASDSRLRALAPLGSHLYFLSGGQLWRTDGSVNGTEPATGIPSQLLIEGLLSDSERVFLVGEDDRGSVLYSFSPATGLSPVPGIPDEAAFFLDVPFVVDGRLFFASPDGAGDTQLWTADGSSGGTRRLTDLDGGLEPSAQHLAVLGERILLSRGDELLVSPALGQPFEGLLRTCDDDSECFFPIGTPLVPVGDGTAFVARTPELGSEVWVTDGTAAGTEPLVDICPGPCSSSPSALLAQGAGLFFEAIGDDEVSREIWQSDGTGAGTRRIARLLSPVAGPFSDGSPWIAELPDSFLFSLSQPDTGFEPWTSRRSDGRARLLLNIKRILADSGPQHLVKAGDRLVFSADSALFQGGGFSAQVFAASTDGATAEPLSAAVLDKPQVQGAAEHAFFLLRDPGSSSTTTLWSSDGTPAGTVPVVPSIPNSQDVFRAVAELGGEAYLALRAGGESSLWRSDGTAAGTVEVLDLDPSSYYWLGGLRTDGERLFYLGSAIGSGCEVYTTDGSGSPPESLGPIRVDEDGCLGFVSLERLTRAAGETYFFVQEELQAHSLWRTDSASGGLLLLRAGLEQNRRFQLTEMAALDAPGSGQRIFFPESQIRFDVDRNRVFSGLWTCDGTEEGTVPVLDFPTETQSGEIEAVGDLLYLVMDDGVHGPEVWQSDGTAAGSRMVRDIGIGPAGFIPHQLTGSGDLLFFVADDGAHGAELWRSDGTEEGTRLVHDVFPGAQPSNPEQLTVVGDKLYFTADDGLTGRELWVLPLVGGGPPCRASEEALCLQGGRFKVEVQWRDFQGRLGNGQAVPLTADTGYFWFFSEDNVEAILKVLDGRTNNGHFWSFYGALSNVEYNITVTDAETGLTRRYFNPSRNFASVGDTRSFGPLGANATFSPEPATAAGVLAGGLEIGAGPLPPTLESQGAPVETCTPSSRRLCLNGGRFAVEATWADFSGNAGDGTAISLTDDTGYFWFFRDSNVETVLKVLDGRANNGNFWVFYGSLSNVDFDLTVTDTATGRVKTYQNRGRTFASVGDTEAFAGV